jgi:hypothetical protein
MIEGRTRFDPERNRAGVVVLTFSSDFGDLDILQPDNFVPSDAVLGIDPSRLMLAKLGAQPEPFDRIDLGQTGLAKQIEVVEEHTLEQKNAGTGGHFLNHNLAPRSEGVPSHP